MRRSHGTAKKTVESRRKISISWLNKKGYLKKAKDATGITVGSISWNDRWGMSPASVIFGLDLNEPGPYMLITYEEQNLKREQQIPLEKMPCHFGGYRWFFKCRAPGRFSCGRKVGIVYEIDGSFMCRDCANLTYDRQNDHKRLRGYPAGILYNVWKSDRFHSKVKREFYAGKPTKKYKRYLQLRGTLSDGEIGNASTTFLRTGR